MWYLVEKCLTVSGDASAKVTEIRNVSETSVWLKTKIPYLLLNLVLILMAIFLLIKSDGVLKAVDPDVQKEL